MLTEVPVYGAQLDLIVQVRIFSIKAITLVVLTAEQQVKANGD